MSSYKIILEVSRLLHDTLWNGFAGDDALTQHVPNAESIVLMNPADTSQQSNQRLSLWLYQVQGNEFLRNQPLQRVANQDDMVQFPPLVLNLFYLLTPGRRSLDWAGEQRLGPAVESFAAGSGALRGGYQLSLPVPCPFRRTAGQSRRHSPENRRGRPHAGVSTARRVV